MAADWVSNNGVRDAGSFVLPFDLPSWRPGGGCFAWIVCPGQGKRMEDPVWSDAPGHRRT